MIEKETYTPTFIQLDGESLAEVGNTPEDNVAPTKGRSGQSAAGERSTWARAQLIMVLGEQALTLHPVNHLLYLCGHYRLHGFTRLLWLYDIVTKVRTFGNRSVWEDLVTAARRQHLATTLYYCLRWRRNLFAVAIPQAVLAQLHPPLACRLIVERIAIPDPAWALSAASEGSRRVIAHYAMVDSSLRLLNAGVVAFFPLPTTLVRRYMDESRLPLQLFFLYYLGHPWFTLAKAWSYLLKSRRKRGKQP